jgi:hypothetical protein
MQWEKVSQATARIEREATEYSVASESEGEIKNLRGEVRQWMNLLSNGCWN